MPDEIICISGVTMEQFIEAVRQARDSMGGMYASVASISLGTLANIDAEQWRRAVNGSWYEEKRSCPMKI